MIKDKTKYNTLMIQACVGGWLVVQKGKPNQVYVRWDSLLDRLKMELTSSGDKKEME